MSDERERALAEYRESLDLGESVDNEDFRAGYDAAEAKSQERIRELDAELDQKHAKLVEVADKLRAARGVIAATQKVIDWNVKHHGSPAIGYREIEDIFRALSTPPPIHEMPRAVTDPDAPDEIDPEAGPARGQDHADGASPRP